MECSKSQSGVRKAKKKQGKDEIDRLKQAEKKKRRLEKALATSAAIISELEKKKQRKKEEEQRLERLDEEGAAIAEAVALHVLLGEDLEDSRKSLLKNSTEFSPWDCSATNLGRALLPSAKFSRGQFGEVSWFQNTQESECLWNEWANGACGISPGSFFGGQNVAYFDEEVGWGAEEISAGLIAALQIAEDESVDTFVFDKMVTGSE